jgi:hypothetical protein
VVTHGISNIKMEAASFVHMATCKKYRIFITTAATTSNLTIKFLLANRNRMDHDQSQYKYCSLHSVMHLHFINTGHIRNRIRRPFAHSFITQPGLRQVYSLLQSKYSRKCLLFRIAEPLLFLNLLKPSGNFTYHKV